MFIGEYTHNLDSKGRLAVPVKFREALKGGAVVTRGIDKCLTLYAIREWRKIADCILPVVAQIFSAVGQNTLLNNISGLLNTAVGADTMFQNTNGIYNVAVGTDALHLSYSGNWNVAIGSLALYDITTGANNTALGYWSGKGLAHGSGNTILGANTTVSSGVSNNIILADGNGTIRLRDDGTNWTFAGGVLVTNGNVGIGTTAPLAPLSVSNSAATLFQLSSPGNNAVATITTNGSAKFQSGTYYPSNTFLPTAAMLGAGGFWLVNSNGNLVTLYSLDGSTTAMKVLAP